MFEDTPLRNRVVINPFTFRHETPETRDDPAVWVRPGRPHDPNYTQQERPYAYSEFFLFGHRDDIAYDPEDPKGVVHAEYSDRLRQRDYDRFLECWGRHNPKNDWWDNASKSGIEKFLRDYLAKPRLTLVAVAQGCNVSNGYPYWIVWFRDGEKK